MSRCTTYIIAALFALPVTAQQPDATTPRFEEIPRPVPQVQAGAAPVDARSAAEMLTEAEIRKLRDRVEGQAESIYQQAAPTETRSGTIPISLAPGAAGQLIKVAHGYVLALEFVDASGNPWPVRYSSAGQASAFVVTQPVPNTNDAPASTAPPTPIAATGAPPATPTPTPAPVLPAADPYPPGSNILTVSSNPDYPYAATNLLVLLAGETRPITLILKGTEVPESGYQDRYIVSVDAYGPMAPKTTLERSTAGLNDTSDLFQVIDGLPPTAQARELFAASGPAPARARADDAPEDITPNGSDLPITGRTRYWREGRMLWIRTEDTLLIPAPVKQVARGSWKAYQVPYLPSILMLVDGRPTSIDLAR